MADKTAIEWTDMTHNPWLGCTRVSPGCQRCFAEALAKRTGMAQWGPSAERRLTSDAYWRQPLKWQAKAHKEGRRFRVFCGSMCDVFDDHPSIKPEWRIRLWSLIAVTPRLDWLLLTKRPQNWPLMLPVAEPQPPFSNIRLGVTIEDQQRFDERAPVLQFAADIGWPTFVSYEPALGPVDWTPAFEGKAIGWLIAGDESGPKRRPTDENWYRDVRDHCITHDVPFLLKQRVEGNRKISLPLLDGQQWAQFPERA